MRLEKYIWESAEGEIRLCFVFDNYSKFKSLENSASLSSKGISRPYQSVKV